MKLLPRGGYLQPAHVRHFMTDELFRKMLHNAAEDAGVQLRQIESRQQAPDHPILWNVPETDYLKFLYFSNRLVFVSDKYPKASVQFRCFRMLLFLFGFD